MSRQTEMTQSFTRPLVEPAEAILDMMRILQPERILNATRSVGESHEFEILKAYMAGESQDYDSADSEDLGEVQPIDQAAWLYRDGTCLNLILGSSIQ